jgi:hypothetical protein
VALVAQHLLDAGAATNVDRVARIVCRAGEDALARHAADSAIELVTRARARLGGRLDEAMGLMLDLVLADAQMRARPSDEARALCADCASRANRLGLEVDQARAALTYGREIMSGRVDSLMVSLLEGALAVVPAAERSLRARVLSRLASALVPPQTDEGLAVALAHAREAIRLARETDDVPTLLHSLLWGGRALGYVIPLAERIALMSELVSLSREHGADLTLIEIGGFHAVSLLETGRPVAAHREAEAFVRLVESLPLPGVRWKAAAARATFAAIDGHMDEANGHIAELRRAASTSQYAAVAWALFEIALCACLRDRERLHTIESDVMAILGRSPVLGPWAGCVHALAGRRSDALACLRPVVELARGVPAIVLSAETAVLLESAAVAEALYEPLAKEAPNARFFWGPTGVFPFGTISRLLGELALLRGDHERARLHLDAAIAECREMEVPPFLALCEQARARVPGPATPAQRSPRPPEMRVSLSREADVWVVSATTHAPFRVKHAKGLEYLHHLLESPGREVYVLILAGIGEGPEDAGAILDERAKQDYKRRVDELEDQRAEAERLGDRGRATRAREELEAIAEQLASAVGLGGRDRKAASNVERARINVQRRIKESIRRIGEHDAAVGRYLEASICTGTYCVYKPL